MTCVICKNGETVPGETIYTGMEGETIVVIKGVPANVCDNCGEAYISSETTARLFKTVNDSANANAEVVVMTYRERELNKMLAHEHAAAARGGENGAR